MSHYWDIRKRKALNYLPPPEPVMEKAGTRDDDPRLAQSRAWMQRYYEEKRNAKAEQDAKREHSDAPGTDSGTTSGEAPACGGGRDAQG